MAFSGHNMTPKVKAITGTKKRRFSFSTSFPDTQHDTASYWSEGSKSSYRILNIQTGETGHPPCGSYPTFQAAYVLKPNEILIETGTFCGKPATPHIICREDDEIQVKHYLGI